MKKIIRHKWKLLIGRGGLKDHQCKRCGCIRYWDFDYDHVMYKWGTHITYRAPSCIIENGVPYNKR